jgi:type IV secretory pathway VirB3-like protein
MNKRLLVFGVDRQIFWAVLGAGVFVFYTVGLIAAVLTSALMFMGASLITKEDPKVPEVLINSISLVASTITRRNTPTFRQRRSLRRRSNT